jgi:hypothetical protein
MPELGRQIDTKCVETIPIIMVQQKYMSSREVMEGIERKIASSGDQCSDKNI